MQYRKFGKTGCDVSVLGFGCMRFPTNEDGSIDEPAVDAMLKFAVDRGLNYVDTAWPYHGGESESVLGRVLAGGYRDKVYLATKSPIGMLKSPADFDRILDAQLKKLQTDHIDFYLLHNLNGINWPNVALKFKTLERLEAAQKEGKIGHLGFSFHDHYDVFKEIVDYYPNWEFCLIQLNYLDVEFQAGVKGAKYAADKGLGVAIMEPLRGGFLADIPARAAEIFAAAPIQKSQVEWAFDFLWNMPEVSLLLSGMGKMKMVEENVEYAHRAAVGMFGPEETEILEAVQKRFEEYSVIPCTGCSYCVPCPMNVAIPVVLTIYNRLQMGVPLEDCNRMYAQIPPPYGDKASLCFDCHRCERLCPQKIKIVDELKKVKKVFEGIDEEGNGGRS